MKQKKDYLIGISYVDFEQLFLENKYFRDAVLRLFNDLNIEIKGFIDLFETIIPISKGVKVLMENSIYMHISCTELNFINHFNLTNGLFSKEGVFPNVIANTYFLSNYTGELVDKIKENLIDDIKVNEELGEYIHLDELAQI